MVPPWEPLRLIGLFLPCTCSPTQTAPVIRNKEFQCACCLARPLALDFLFANLIGSPALPGITPQSPSPLLLQADSVGFLHLVTHQLAPGLKAYLICNVPRPFLPTLFSQRPTTHVSMRVGSFSAQVLSIETHQKSTRRLFPVT